jgi:hypothetical protein
MTYWTQITAPQTTPKILEDYSSGAAIGESWNAGIAESIGLAIDAGNIQNLQRGQQISRWGGFKEPSTAIVPPSEMNRRIDAAGLTGKLNVPFTDVRDATLQYLIDRKKEQVKREDILNRSEPGIINSSARFVVRFAANMADPVNVVSAFIPVVSEARYAAWLAKAGGIISRSAVRAGVGAVEGAVGQAVIEPLRIAQHATMGDPYDVNDSLANIAFGTVFGGGLHVGLGGLVDAARWRTTRATTGLGRKVEAMPIEVKRDLLRTAFSQMNDGRQIDVQGLFDIYGGLTRREGLRNTTALTQRADISIPESELAAPLTAEPGLTGSHGEVAIPQKRADGTDAIYPADKLGFKNEIKRMIDAAATEGRTLVERVLSDGRVALVEAVRAEVIDQFPAKSAADASIKRLPPAERLDLSVIPFNDAERGAGWAVVRGLNKKQAEQVAANPELLPKSMQIYREGSSAPFTPERQVPDLQSIIRESRTPTYRLTNPEASVQADALIKAGNDDAIAEATDQAAAAMEDVTRMSKQMGMDEAPAFKELDAIDADAKTYRRALEAAAACGARR